MTKVLIGHRGVGKTTLLERLKVYFPKLKFADLDQIIEKKVSCSISEVFQKEGEAKFRQIEAETFSSIFGDYDYISLGAGFELDLIPEGVEIIWIRRSTDKLARIFTNRPRLNSKVSPSEEYLERYHTRESNYQSKAAWDYLMPEGRLEPSGIEKSFFDGSLKLNDVMFTLPQDYENRILPILSLNFKKIELRDDILSIRQIEKIFDTTPKSQLLLSFRSHQNSVELLSALKDKLKDVEWDWALENSKFSEVDIKQASILSLHERLDQMSLLSSFEKIEKASAPGQHLKLAVVVNNFKELAQGLAWQAADPNNRSFLPRSGDGRWFWVRLYLKGRQKINFIKYLSGSAIDQPSPFQWLATPAKTKNFAAVLGSPIFHSWSPETHRKFFAPAKIPFWSIDISEAEWEQAFNTLEQLGLRAAAVTSPLKIKAGGVNTLWRKDDSWQKANTDQVGLEALISGVLSTDRCAVWGGGGTLPVIERALPQAHFFSVRTGKSRDSESVDAKFKPDVVIWAASPVAELPPSSFKPRLVIDLNYREDSRAREFAQTLSAQYVSGDAMFFAQALAQQKHWQALS